MRITPINKSLDKKLKILGFEIPDILLIFIFIAFMNFIVKDGATKFIYVWLPAAVFAIGIRFLKRNKPDNFLVHWIKYHLLPSGLRAFPRSSIQNFSFKEKK